MKLNFYLSWTWNLFDKQLNQNFDTSAQYYNNILGQISQ